MRRRATTHQRSAPSRRRGNSLLELVAASTIMAIAVTPALRILRDALRVSRDTETANLLATLSVSRLEANLVSTAAVWSTTTDAGNFAPTYPNIRFQVTRTVENIGAGLMNLTSTTWEDRNGNAAWDAGEPRVVFATKVARNVAYQREASGT